MTITPLSHRASRFEVAPRDAGYCHGRRPGGLFDPRHDYQPDERVEYELGFEEGRADRLTELRNHAEDLAGI